MINKQDEFDCEKYRRWIASLPCLITRRSDVQCAHIRKGYLAGTSRKPPDYRCVPLSCGEHAKQHDIGEEFYWLKYGGYVLAAQFAYELYKVRFNTPAAIKLIENWRRRWVYPGAVTIKHKFIDEGPPNE